MERGDLTTFLVIIGVAVVPLVLCVLACRTLLRKSGRALTRQGYEMDPGVHKAQMGDDPAKGPRPSTPPVRKQII